jgi:hypothetical protein
MRTPTETTCQHSTRTFKLRRGVRSGMGIPFLVALLSVDPLRASVRSKAQRWRNGLSGGWG